MTNDERLEILQRAVFAVLGPLQGPTWHTIYSCPKCPECDGTMIAHAIGCKVWKALYEFDTRRHVAADNRRAYVPGLKTDVVGTEGCKATVASKS